jgi:hypothetical protein
MAMAAAGFAATPDEACFKLGVHQCHESLNTGVSPADSSTNSGRVGRLTASVRGGARNTLSLSPSSCPVTNRGRALATRRNGLCACCVSLTEPFNQSSTPQAPRWILITVKVRLLGGATLSTLQGVIRGPPGRRVRKRFANSSGRRSGSATSARHALSRHRTRRRSTLHSA